MTRYDADPGGPDPGTALRATMTASVSDVRMPADLLDRAVSRNRKRKTRNGLMGAVAAAGALATVIATAPGWTSGHPASARSAVSPHVQLPKVQTAAYVLDHVASALMNSYRMISVDRGSGGLDHGSINYTDVATQQQRYVSGLRDSSGQPYLQSTTSIRHGVWREFDVDYADHLYSTLTASNVDHGQRVTVSSWLPLQTNANPAVAFRQAVKVGSITVVRHRILDGRNPPSWIWVDASTYQVVQTEHFIQAYKGGTSIPPTPRSKLMWIALVDHVTWLPPTRQNLALLTLTPPAGFTNVPYSVMASHLGRIS